MANTNYLTDFEVALLSFLQDASNEFNSEKEVDYFIKKHSPKLLELAYKQKNMIEFKLTEEEEKAARQFMKEHRHPEVNKGAIGGGASRVSLYSYRYWRCLLYALHYMWREEEYHRS